METATYIIRLDDACETQDAQKWNKIEALLDQYNVKPMVAVVPQNKDPELCISAPDPQFWEKVGQWQKKGWAIALHGFDHCYITKGSGLVPLNRRSEFAEVPYETQVKKIENGLQIFKEKGITTSLFIAPSHTFDKHTIAALIKHNIPFISDGFGLLPFKKLGLTWIPQQNWKLVKKKRGLWTSCYHPNMMTAEEFDSLESFLKGNKNHFVDNYDLLLNRYKNRRRTLSDWLFSKAFFSKRKIGRTRLYQGFRKWLRREGVSQ
jgi:predicted deacetylase